eukprot:jgi/Mesen1/13/ME1049539C03915
MWGQHTSGRHRHQPAGSRHRDSVRHRLEPSGRFAGAGARASHRAEAPGARAAHGD